MAAVITNVWAGWLADPLARHHLSRVVLDGCGEFSGCAGSAGPGRYRLFLPAATLNMPPATIRVYDGVVDTVTVGRRSGGAEVEVVLPEAVTPRVTLLAGMPSRVVLDFPASSLVKTFSRRVLALDAGHGGPDAGGLGPIDLLEKDVVLDTTLRLEKLVEAAGGTPILTRRGDANPSPAFRLQALKEARPQAVLSLHTHASPEPSVKGFAVFAHSASARPLAEAVRQSLLRKLELTDRGLFWAAGPPFSPEAHQPSASPPSGFASPPAVTVEIVTISNPVEEGWLRSYVFRQRVAQAVLNGMAQWLRVSDPRPPA